ncbi:prolipoprotein diacylglyceryl transferase [Microbacterium sp. ZW T5_56]|uniref:prolipoprotein diacylglyceryl transferase n=1 Tax=Microbacterium sp. ZW T5_56 TaxID=3378081 RepID=UPI003852BB02
MLLSALALPASIPSPEINGIPTPWGVPIKFYALFIILGIIIATFAANRTLTKRGAEPWVIVDVLLITVPISIIFARFFHVFTHFGFYFTADREWWNPFVRDAIWNIWDGGIAIYGALIGGAIGAWLGCKWTGLRFWTFADAIAPWMLLAQAIGRLGNYFNHELFGLPTDLPWGLEIPRPNSAIPVGLSEDTLFHPTFLYEIIWNVIGVVVLLVLRKKIAMQWGRLFAVYLIWYSAGRVVWESIRIDPSDIILGLRTNVWSAIVGIVIGLIILIVQSRHKGQEPSPYAVGRGPQNAVGSSAATPEYVDVSEPPAQSTDDSEAATSGTPAATTQVAGA